MKKILFINDMVFGGGVENVMYEIISYLYDKDYEITVFTPYFEKKFYESYSPKVKYFYLYRFLPDANNLAVRALKKFFRAIKGIHYLAKYDVVVSMKEGPSTFEALKFKKAKKHISWIHTDYKTLHWTKNYFKSEEDELKLFSKYDKTICVTESAKNNFIEVVGDPKNLVVRYNPVNSDSIVRKSEDECPVLRPDDKTLFVTVGRLCEEKGYKELVSALGTINDRSKMELWIIGGNESYQKDLEELIKAKKLQTTVKLLGEQKNPFTYLKQADFYICSSKTESFCISIQEALVLGIPVLTTDCPGAIELLNPYISIVVKSMDEMREKIIEISESSEISKKYKQNVREHFDCVSADKRLLDIEKLFR